MNKLKLNNLVSIQKGRKVSRIYENKLPNRQRYIQIKDLRNDLSVLYTDESNLVNVTENDIVIAWDGSNAGTVGFGLEGVIGSTLAKIEVKSQYSDSINPIFVGWFLKGIYNEINQNTSGIAIPHINKNHFENIQVPIPPLDYQNNAVAILDKVQSLIEKRKNAIRLLDEILKSKFLRMFGLRNPNFHKWEEVKIQDLAKSDKGSIRTGPFGSNLKHDEFTHNGAVSVLGIDNVVNNIFKEGKRRFITLKKYEELKKYTVYPRDVLITIMGTIGRAAVIPLTIPLSINTKHLAAITLNEKRCNPYYLAYSIHSNPFISMQLKSKNRGIIMEGLNLDIIKNLKLKSAPIELQNKFETIYLSIAKEKEKSLQSLEMINTLSLSMLQKIFKGEELIDEEMIFDDLIMTFSKNDLEMKPQRIKTLVNYISNQKFSDFNKYDKAKSLLFELIENKTKIRQIFRKDKIKLTIT